MRGFESLKKLWKNISLHAGCDPLEEAYFKFFNSERELCLNVKPESILSVLP